MTRRRSGRCRGSAGTSPGALLSFAFDRPAPIVEANTQRVLARWLAWGEDLATTASQARLWRAAGRLVPPEGAGRFNQAFMELGATVCTPRTPSCLICPVAADCLARALGRQDALPIRTPKAPPLAVAEACALVARADGHLLIVRRGPGGLWDGFWEFPTVHVAGADPAGRSFGPGAAVDLAEGVRRLTGVAARIGPVVETVRFGVTKHKVELAAHAAAAIGGDLAPGPGLDRAAWVAPSALGDHPFGAAGRRLIARVLRHGPEGPGPVAAGP